MQWLPMGPFLSMKYQEAVSQRFIHLDVPWDLLQGHLPLLNTHTTPCSTAVCEGGGENVCMKIMISQGSPILPSDFISIMVVIAVFWKDKGILSTTPHENSSIWYMGSYCHLMGLL